jgi:hypothetical protein
MNKYKVILNYQREITEMETEAATHYQAIMNCLSSMAKKYGIKKRTMITYFTADKLNCEVKNI